VSNGADSKAGGSVAAEPQQIVLPFPLQNMEGKGSDSSRCGRASGCHGCLQSVSDLLP
jgi:hypothetical protein